MAPLFIIQRVESPPEDEIYQAAALFVDLMKEDLGALTLAHSLELMHLMVCAMLRPGSRYGEYYSARSVQSGELVGYTMWMPPGVDMFSTDDQRNLGLTEFMSRLPDSTKEFYKTVYLTQFPAVVNEALGSLTAKTDAWWLHLAMVRPNFQKQGVAKTLINLVIDKARAEGQRLALSTTSDDNVPIYTKLGFTLKGTKMINSPLGEWPVHVLEMETADLGSL